MHRIAIIDEEKGDIQRFQLYVHKNDTNKKFDVLPFIPSSNKEELVEDILSSNVDAVVSDYRLNEHKSDVTYTGIDLVNAILTRKSEFPCFVLTSFDDDAIKASNDVNIVYIKGIMSGAESEAKITFIDRVEEQIQKYQAKIKNASEELRKLEMIRKSRLLNPDEEERFVELSHFLDKSIAGVDSIPRTFFSNDTNTKLDSLINLADNLAKKLEKKDELPAKKSNSSKKK